MWKKFKFLIGSLFAIVVGIMAIAFKPVRWALLLGITALLIAKFRKPAKQ